MRLATVYVFAFVLSVCAVQGRQMLNEQTNLPCHNDFDCNNGNCRHFNATAGYCLCNNNFITRDGGEPCGYHQVSILEAFLLSMFVGGFGVDWFVLAKGHAGYIVAGVFKLLTVGGLGVWWLVSVMSSQFLSALLYIYIASTMPLVCCRLTGSVFLLEHSMMAMACSWDRGVVSCTG